MEAGRRCGANDPIEEAGTARVWSVPEDRPVKTVPACGRAETEQGGALPVKAQVDGVPADERSALPHADANVPGASYR